MFNCLPGAMLSSGIRTNDKRAVAAVVLSRTILPSKSQIVQSGAAGGRAALKLHPGRYVKIFAKKSRAASGLSGKSGPENKVSGTRAGSSAIRGRARALEAIGRQARSAGTSATPSRSL